MQPGRLLSHAAGPNSVTPSLACWRAAVTDGTVIGIPPASESESASADRAREMKRVLN